MAFAQTFSLLNPKHFSDSWLFYLSTVNLGGKKNTAYVENIWLILL